MGFNFSAFVGGAAKGLADVVTEQRKDFDESYRQVLGL